MQERFKNITTTQNGRRLHGRLLYAHICLFCTGWPFSADRCTKQTNKQMIVPCYKIFRLNICRKPRTIKFLSLSHNLSLQLAAGEKQTKCLLGFGYGLEVDGSVLVDQSRIASIWTFGCVQTSQAKWPVIAQKTCA